MSDFTIAPDYIFEEQSRFQTLISQFENGAEQRRAKWSSGQKIWSLNFKNKTQDEFETVIAFFESKQGAYGSFTWTNPNDDTEYTVRFQEDSVTFQNKSFGVFDFGFKFIEVK